MKKKCINTKFIDELSKYKVKCKCGHTQILTNRFDRVLCSYCGNYIYRDKKTEFMYKLKDIEKR